MRGLPVLIDFERSIVSSTDFFTVQGASEVQRERGPMHRWLKAKLSGGNPAALRCADLMASALGTHARVLVIGGGERTPAVRLLEERVRVFVADIYASDALDLIADAHRLPFEDAIFDGVWIQAVLEHVLSPSEVVAEIHRVLKPDGWVFSDLPFMQQVHERGRDFTRLTLAGHRWLFREFSLLETGQSSGAGTALSWALRYFARSVTRNDGIGNVVAALTSWLRLFDRGGKADEDAACGTYFLGQRAERALRPRDIVQFYDRRL